jgi:hypothetical protein
MSEHCRGCEGLTEPQNPSGGWITVACPGLPSPDVAAVIAALRGLILADGHLNIWCMATHGHVPLGWKDYTAALKVAQDALDTLDAAQGKERANGNHPTRGSEGQTRQGASVV